MGDLVLFLSKSVRLSIEKSDALYEAVNHLARVIAEITSSPEERAEWISDAYWLLKEIIRDSDSSTGAA